MEGHHTHKQQYSHPVPHPTKDSSCSRFSQQTRYYSHLNTFAVSNCTACWINSDTVYCLCQFRVKKPGSKSFCLLKKHVHPCKNRVWVCIPCSTWVGLMNPICTHSRACLLENNKHQRWRKDQTLGQTVSLLSALTLKCARKKYHVI